MKRRDFLKILGLGSAALSTTTYFDMGRGLWRQKKEIEGLKLLELSVPETGTVAGITMASYAFCAVFADTGEPVNTEKLCKDGIVRPIGIMQPDGSIATAGQIFCNALVEA